MTCDRVMCPECGWRDDGRIGKLVIAAFKKQLATISCSQRFAQICCPECGENFLVAPNLDYTRFIIMKIIAYFDTKSFEAEVTE